MTHDERRLRKLLWNCGASVTHWKMALILLKVNGLDNALRFVDNLIVNDLVPVRPKKLVLSLSEAQKLSTADVFAQIDWDRASAQYEGGVRLLGRNPLVPYEACVLYPWKWDKIMGSIFRLVIVRVDEIEAAELDWKFALRHWSTQMYIKWYRQGHRPPLITVIQREDGQYISLNRRRWLAARETGINHLWAWFSDERWVRPLCSWDHAYTCYERQFGGSCVSCDKFAERSGKQIALPKAMFDC